MRINDGLDENLQSLRDEWPRGSMVKGVMDRIAARRSRRVLAGMAASGLLATLAIAWIIVATRTTTLMASVRESIQRSASAHMIITTWNDNGVPVRSDIWHRRDEGIRVESPDHVLIENATYQWKWPIAPKSEQVVIRQRSPGFFTTQLGQMMALPDLPADWRRVRTPDLDRDINGQACRGFTLQEPGSLAQRRDLIFADKKGRIHEINGQTRLADGTWQYRRQISIEYDVPVSAEKFAARLPEGARIVDRDGAFRNGFPLEKALHQIEIGGLILAVHDLQPLKNREGFYVVSSVRGTPEFLKQFPPRIRPINHGLVVTDVAVQPGSNMMQGAKYDRIVMASATRDGVEFSWWLIVPRRLFQMKDGKRMDLPETSEKAVTGEPGWLDDLPGKARLPLSATYWDEKHRDANGVQLGVESWVEVPLSDDRPATTLDDAAARTRQDLLVMGLGSAGGMFGVLPDAPSEPNQLRALSHFSPETTSDADFAAAVRRGLDDLRQFDELRPDDMLPPLGKPSRCRAIQ